MKKLILAATALSMLATPMVAAPAMAQSRHTTTVVKGPHGRTVVKRTTVTHKNWKRGQRFDRRYATNYRVVDYRTYRGHGVYAPPRGYHWVRSGNDAVLVGITTGLVAAVIAGAIN